MAAASAADELHTASIHYGKCAARKSVIVKSRGFAYVEGSMKSKYIFSRKSETISCLRPDQSSYSFINAVAGNNNLEFNSISSDSFKIRTLVHDCFRHTLCYMNV